MIRIFYLYDSVELSVFILNVKWQFLCISDYTQSCLSLIVNMSIDLWAVMVEEGVQREINKFLAQLLLCIYVCL